MERKLLFSTLIDSGVELQMQLLLTPVVSLLHPLIDSQCGSSMPLHFHLFVGFAKLADFVLQLLDLPLGGRQLAERTITLLLDLLKLTKGDFRFELRASDLDVTDGQELSAVWALAGVCLEAPRDRVDEVLAILRWQGLDAALLDLHHKFHVTAGLERYLSCCELVDDAAE